MMNHSEELGREIATQTDALVGNAVSRYLKTEQWDIHSIAHLMVRHVYHDGREVYYFGGIPIIELFPIEVTGMTSENGYTVKATRKYKILVED